MSHADQLRCTTLAELLEAAAAVGPPDALRFRAPPGEGGAVAETTTASYAALADDARRVLGGLRASGARRGDPVLLIHESAARFYAAFWGCQLGGLVAVPVGVTPGADRADEARRLITVWRTMGRPLIVTERAYVSMVAALVTSVDPGARVLAHEDLAAAPAATTLDPGAPDDLALVQFSSGSTSAPKGVRLTHANLVANSRQMAGRAPLGRDMVEVGWMPHYHDMGLIGCHLAPMLVAGRQVKMGPLHFLRRPLDWLDLATHYRATLLTGTNTSLRLVLRRLARTAPGAWDLASVESLYVGAEPIAPATVRAFVETFAPFGLRRTAVRAAYGLAEASVGVAMGLPEAPRWHRVLREPLARREVIPAGDADPRAVVELLAIGPPLEGEEVRIVGDDDAPVPAGAVGHVQTRGPNVTSGYYEDPAATAAARCDGFWRTGDLGFMADGRLVICGRTKELLFAGGRNLYAQDVEAVACETKGLRAAVACAAPGAGADGAEERTLLFLVPDGEDWRAGVEVLRAARRHVQQALRLTVDQVVPIAYREIPRTSSGKVRRFRLAQRFAAGEFDAVVAELATRVGPETPPPAPARPAGPMLPLVVAAWAGALRCDPRAVGPDVPFSELSGSSVVAQDILARLEQATGRWLGYDVLLECETPAQMAAWLEAGRTGRARVTLGEPAPAAQGGAVAIVGLGCRFPGAAGPDDFWRALVAGVDAVRPFPAGRFGAPAAAGLRCRTGSFLDDPYAFDPAFFGIGADEAAVMDPQQRLMLEVACECLQRGGYGGARREGLRVGVFVGASQLGYQERLVAGRERAAALQAVAASAAFGALDAAAQEELRRVFAHLAPERATHPNTMVGNLLNMLAARVAHELDLRGPALAVDTACSSALVALHLACDSLRRGECELAVAGGVSLNLTPSGYRLFEAAGALSPTGRSRPFAADADGFVPGEGAGAVLLKPLAAARADGDPIVAVIRGSAMNNDGRSLGAMAPNPDGQLEVLRAAYAAAGVDPASVSAVECHGTGTRIGDPVELRSVAELFGATGGPLWVGSVKSNLGHLLGAAGVAGLLKTVLALAHRTLPPTLHATPPSPLLERAARLRLVTETTAWAGPAPRRAGVSSFGFGGTNCHVVLEEAPPVAAPVADAAGPRLLALSAPSAAHLAADAARLGASGALDGPGAAGRDAELLAARPQLPVRAARVLAAGEPAGPALAALAAGGPAPGWLRAAGPRRRAPQVAWLFPGQGAQHPRQALGLYRGWPAFRERLEALCGLVTLERPLIDFCYGVDVDAEALRRTDVAQPLLVAFQIALAQCLLDLGLRPAAVLGHSVGELAAAAIAGALEPADAVRLAALRGRLMEEHGGAGAMLAVYASAADIDAALGPAAIAFGPDLGVAAINGPRQTVLAGARPALAAAQAALERARIGAQAVPVRHAFHSPLMAEAAARFARAAIALAPRPFTVPLVSTVRGAPLEGRDFTLAYLAEQIREPVRFAAAFDALAALRIDAFLDLGPGATLAGLARHALPAGDARPALACCRAPDAPDEDADRAQALRALGELWVQGAPLRALPAAGPAPRPRPTVPPLAFVEGHYAIEDGAAADAVAAGPDAPAATAVLHVRRFRPAPAPPPRPLAGTWLILGDDAARLEAVRAALVAAGAGAISAPSGEAFVREADDRVRLDPTRRDHVRWLLDMAAGRAPAGLVLLTALDEPRAAADPGGARSFAILAALAHAVRAARAPWPLTVVTRGGLAVGAGEAPEPLQAAIGAMAQALACELPESRGRVVDLAADDPAAVAAAVVAELAAPGPELLIARRGGGRFAPRLTAVAAPAQPLPAGGAYLVLGGAGGVGAALCRWLAAPAGAQARVVVTAGRGGAGALGAELAGRGVQTEHVTLDVRDAAALRRAVAELGARHGRLHAVVHCAGVLEVGALEHRDPGRLRLVLDTKMRGAAGLAAAVAGQPVDRVVLISSVAGAVPVLGRGLCDYAAANAFLDALATRESTAATRWSAVAYSRWRGIGMAAGLDDRTADAGPLRHPLAAEAAARAFGAALGCVEPHVIVADPADVAGWDEAAAGAELNRQDAKAPVVQRQSGGPAVLNGSAHLIEVAAPDPAPTAADESLEQFLRRRLAQATGGAAADLDPDAPFQRLGLTSLAAVDLLKELEARIGRPLGVTLLFEHNTLAKVLAFLDAEAPAAAPSAPAATPVREEAIPLLPAQQTFYANQAFFPHLPCYVFLRLDLAGEVAPAALDEALALLGERHPMLGVGFEWLDGKLVQRRRGGAHRALVRDLTAAAPREREALLLRWEEQLRNEVYDLARGPLLRVGLARTAPGQHSLLFNVHHIVADAWSTQLLVTELLELHGALRDRRPPGLAPLRSGFADCARAIEDLARAGGAESLAYWERALAGAPPGLALPFDGDPRAEVRGTCQLLQRVLDEPTTRGLERTARAWDVSFFHVLLASYLVALRRWSGQDDLVVRVANARREARVPDIERVVGCFADSLPVRVRVDGGAGARALCATVREAVVAAQRYPLASSVQLAGVAGARDHLGPRGVTPAGISFPNFPAPERFGGLTVTGMRAGSASGFTQLGLIAWSFGSRLHVSWNTIDGLFRPATVARLSGEHEEVLRALAAGADAPDRRVADRGHRGPAPAPAAPARPAGAPPRPRPGALLPGAVVHERIFARAAACPAAAAVIAPTGTVRYAELAQRAANLGAELGAAGARPGVRVGLLCRPSPELAIGALGILGTGAAYVPIDPEYPDGRVQAIARHAGFALLVTTADQLPRLGALAGGALGTVVLLDEPGALARPLVPAGLALLTPRDLPADAAPPPPGRVGPDDLAYILYTSGTTGTPKGVMVQHRSLTLFLDWVHETFAVTPDDRFIQTAPLSFGAGLRQVYSPLLAGAALVPTPRGLARDPQALARFIETTGITIWNSVPTLWMLLLDAIEQLEAEGEAIRLERLRWVLIGGEDLPANHVRRWWDRFGPRHRIANVYGGAETITNCLYHVVPARPADGEIRIPIGVSAAGAEPLILDEHGGVERGDAVGEIAIGGPKLAVGYLDDPERTAAVFVPHPEGRGRIYRTGDLGRRDAAGNIVFLGRADSQVKIHGHRVELSEIENTLNLHPAVRAAAVLLHDDGHHQRLEAYLEPARPGAECDVRELRGHLEPRLPAYMVPHRFTWVAALPRNPIGKIDRRALRPPGAAPAAAASPAPDPRRTQAIVADAWRQVLGVAAVKPEDDFFELGGDSILALEVLQRLRGKVPVLPRPITLYGERTLARLAAAIDGLAGNGNRETGRRGDDRGSVAPSSTEHGSSAHRTNHPQGPPRLPASLFNCDGRLPLTPTQESFVLAQRLRPEVSPVWCARLPLRGALDPTLLGRALAAVVERHDLLRTVFETDAGLKTWQRVLPPAGAALAVEDLTRLPPAEREARLAAWFAAEQRSRFDLDRWPLWRFRLVALDDERWELLVTMHHAVADGWSCHVLGAELIAAYRQLAQGAPVALPPLASTFADVVAAAPAGGADEHAAARRYWAERFARPWPDVRRLGAARDDAAVSPHVILDEATTTALRRHAAGARRSLHALVLAAWARALTRATGDRDLVLGCALAGRDLPVPGADRLFGPLATALPLRLEVGGGAFADDLGTVDAAFTAACVHAGLPVDELLRQIPRHPGAPYPPGRQLFFTFMDFSALPPLGDAGLAVDLDAARFHFAAQATDTEMMLGALAGTRLRLHVHGQAAADRRAAALEEVARELAALVRAPAVTEPRAPAPAPAPAAAPVALDAAVVAYLPDPRRLAGLLPAGVDLDGARAFVRRALFPAAAPRLAEVQQTRLGSSGAVMLPYFADELASVAPDELAERAAEAVELCERHGARCVSFAGLLPSATRYGVAIARALERRRGAAPDAPRARVTTGHAATAAAVVANVAHVLEAVGARLPDLAVAVVGFGSIGQAALRLLLATQPAPRALAVSDLAREREHLRAPLADLARLAPGPIAFLPWEGAPPAALDDYDLIIGASSAGGLLDPERLRPGTLLVDDSFPPLCEEAAAVRRMTARQDVLIVGGGTLAIAAEQLDLPLALPGEAAAAALRAFATRGMPGCRAESLLISREPSLPAALGLVDPDAAARYWRVLADLAIAPAPLHCGAFTIPAVIVDAVRRRRA